MDAETIEKLKAYFAVRDDVSMAFLFGSQAEGTAIAESDTDIAVYFKPEGRHLEWEETKEYEGEHDIWIDVSSMVPTQSTDLVVLNRAPSPLAHGIVETGIPLLIRDKILYWRFLFLVNDAAEDFYPIAREWMAIRERSHSLSEKDEIALKRLLDFIETQMARLKDFTHINQRTYERDQDEQLRLERWVERLAIALVDTAKLVLASERKIVLPQSYAEIVKALGWAMNVPKPDVNLLAQFAELRNLLAHEYLDLRYAKIRTFLDNAGALYMKVLAFARKYIEDSKTNR